MRITFRPPGASSIERALGKPGATLASHRGRVEGKPEISAAWSGRFCMIKTQLVPSLKLQTMWQALPAPAANQPDVVRAKCVEMRDFVVKIRAHTAMQFAAPVVKGLPAGSQPLLNWKLREFASHRRDSDPNDLRNDTDPPRSGARNSRISRTSQGSRSALGRSFGESSRGRCRSRGSGRPAQPL